MTRCYRLMESLNDEKASEPSTDSSRTFSEDPLSETELGSKEAFSQASIDQRAQCMNAMFAKLEQSLRMIFMLEMEVKYLKDCQKSK